MHFGKYAEAFDNRALAGTLVKVLTSPPLDFSFEQFVQLLMDRAEYGLVAADTLQCLMPTVSAHGCLSHTLDHVGEHMAFPHLHEARSVLNALMSKSLNARSTWQIVTGTTFKRVSKTRWWSEFETSVLMHEALPRFTEWLQHPKLNDNKTVQKLKSLWQPVFQTVVDYELTVMKATAEPFVKATYRLEGDQSSNAFVAYDIIEGLSAIQATQLPNMDFPAVQDLAFDLAARGVTPPYIQVRIRSESL